LEKCFEYNKEVYIPKVIGRKPEDMVMCKLQSMNEIERYPKNKWGIPEPDVYHQCEHINCFRDVDVILLPAVAFDSRCGRLGHGKGYYGE
jgi:5-formyltetrahydrofolate cyclo-ligase